MRYMRLLYNLVKGGCYLSKYGIVEPPNNGHIRCVTMVPFSIANLDVSLNCIIFTNTCTILSTVEVLKNGQIGTRSFVLYMEFVPFRNLRPFVHDSKHKLTRIWVEKLESSKYTSFLHTI